MSDNRYAPPNAEVSDLPAQNITQSSSSVLRRATWILWVSFMIGVVNVALDWTYLTTLGSTKMAVGVLALTFGIIVFLTYHIGRGKNWARIVFLIMVLIGLPSLLDLPATFSHSIIAGSFIVIITVLQLLALYIVFFTSARHSFKKH